MRRNWSRWAHSRFHIRTCFIQEGRKGNLASDVVGWRNGALDAKVQDGPREWIEDGMPWAQVRSRLRRCDDERNTAERNTTDEHG
jgi:hypothetical protein